MFDRELAERIEQIRTELRERERHLKTPVVLNVCEAVVEILASKGADRWNEDLYASFCRKWGLSDDDGNPRVGEQELFRINVALCHVLRLLRKQGLKIGHWPVVPLRYRQNLAFEYDGEIFSSLWRFERLVARLVSRKPNFGMKSEEVCARLVLAAIALDGMVFDNADGRLAGLRADDVKLEEVGVIRLPTRSGKRPKHFYIGGYTGTCLKILLPRARRGAPIFPQTWQSGQGKKKTERRRALEALISQLWNEEFPYEDPPQSLDVCYWLRASRMSLALGGMPALLLANLAGKIRGAQFPHWNESIEGSKSPENERECMRLVELHALFPDSRQGKRKAKLGSAKRLRALLHRTREDWEKENADRNERILLDWLIWLAENKRFSDMTLSTFRGHVYVVANRIFPLPVEKSLDELSVEDWETIGRRLVTNDDLAPSTRRTAMTHLRRLHEFLSERGEAPPVDFGRTCFKVPREVAECGVPFPHEVDALLDLLDAEGKEELWLATVCSFYLGLRCEELVHLRRADVQDGYRLSVRVSKLLSSRRTIPYNLLLPEPVRSRFEILVERTGCRDEYLLRSTADPFLPMAPWQLSKAMGRMLQRVEFPVRKMHALRHGFASWTLTRYFMLIDKEFRKDLRAGIFHPRLDASHPWFEDSSLADIAEVFGGRFWRCRVMKGGECMPNASDLLGLSRLLGHTSRFTTLENYTNTIGWLGRYYLLRRERGFLDLSRARRSSRSGRGRG